MADDPPDIRRHPLQRKAPPWRATLAAQAFLCVGLYLAFKVGAPRSVLLTAGGVESGHESSRGINDIHFLSVAGGPRPINEQMQLLGLMNAAAKFYNVKFIVCLTEFGDNDALLNATPSFGALRVPWLTTGFSHAKEKGYFLKQFRISEGKTLDIIGLDARFWKGGSNQQLNWIKRALGSTNGTWHVVIGLHPLTNCDNDQITSGRRSAYSYLSGIFLKQGVDLYISKQRCSATSGHTVDVSYIRNTGHVDEEFGVSLRMKNGEMDRRLVDGFYLHRVSLLEMETFFINLAGHVTSRHSVHHFGRGAI